MLRGRFPSSDSLGPLETDEDTVDEHAHLNGSHASRSVPLVGAHGLSDDSDDASAGSGHGDVLERVLVSHMHATRRHSLANEGLGLAHNGVLQSPFVVGSQKAAF